MVASALVRIHVSSIENLIWLYVENILFCWITRAWNKANPRGWTNLDSDDDGDDPRLLLDHRKVNDHLSRVMPSAIWTWGIVSVRLSLRLAYAKISRFHRTAWHSALLAMFSSRALPPLSTFSKSASSRFLFNFIHEHQYALPIFHLHYFTSRELYHHLQERVDRVLRPRVARSPVRPGQFLLVYRRSTDCTDEESRRTAVLSCIPSRPWMYRREPSRAILAVIPLNNPKNHWLVNWLGENLRREKLTHDIEAPSLLDSELSLANPANFPDSFTEKISRTLRHSRYAWFRFDSFCGSVLQTPLAFDSVTFSALLDLMMKNLPSNT